MLDMNIIVWNVLIVLTVCLSSCGLKENKLPDEVENHSTMKPMQMDTVNFLLKQISQQGDSIAYNRISGEFYYFHRDEQLLYYALIMANKYDYGYACAHVANLFLSISQNSLNELDVRTKKLVLFYALRARELGYEIKVNSECILAIDTLPPAGEYLNL